MKLTINERIVLFELLPKEGSFSTLKILREAREALELTPKERKDWEVQITPQGAIQWNPKKAKAVEVNMKDVQDIAKAALEKLDKDEKLADQHVTLYEKIVLNK